LAIFDGDDERKSGLGIFLFIFLKKERKWEDQRIRIRNFFDDKKRMRREKKKKK
jgi:hypothetical protein